MARKPTITETLLRNSDKSLPLLDVPNLTVEFATRRGMVVARCSINISVAKGRTLAIVGKSGSGKSVTSYAVMRILDRAGRRSPTGTVISTASICATHQKAKCAICAAVKCR